MKSFNYTIKDPQGIHARPAGLLVKAAAEFQSDVKIVKEGKESDAKRIIGVMSLGVKAGESITINIDGADEDAACEKLENFFKDNL